MSVIKLSTCILLLALMSFNVNGQNWQIYNDTNSYFYKASNTGDIFTLRTKTKYYSETDSTIWFTDNYIPIEPETENYYGENGSVWGDSIRFSGDTLWMDGNHIFINNKLVGTSWEWTESIEITLTHETDTMIFDLPDSVRYYYITGGNRIIQSKKYGLLEFPRLSPETSITYNLIGIERIVGQQFDKHNLIFDFELEDQLIYQEHYYRFDGDDWEEEYYSIEGILFFSKSIIEEHNFYLPYPILFPFDPDSLELHDYPGEVVKNIRLGFLLDSFDHTSGINDKGDFLQDLGWRPDSTEEGHYVECVGFSELSDDYTTFGESSSGSIFYPDLNYTEGEICEARTYGNVWCTYEEGFGLTHYFIEGVESFYRIDLVGAVKSGVEMGVFFELGLNENENNRIFVYPNPTNNTVSFSTELHDLYLFNALGKEILHFSELTLSLDLSNQPSGIYYVKALNMDENPVQTLVVKN